MSAAKSEDTESECVREICCDSWDLARKELVRLASSGHIVYFNKYCSRYVDRKSEYIGRDIRACHKEAESVARIDAILETLSEGQEREVHYENRRGARHLAVTVSRFEIDGELLGFIQSFVVKKR